MLQNSRHAAPLLLLVLLPIFVNAPALSGYFNTDPTLQFIGLAQNMRGGWLSPPMGWLDPSVGYITEAVGHLVASDWFHGIIPWWNPYSGIGMPLAAEMQTSAFFLPFVLLLAFSHGWLWLEVTLQIGCGVFTYLLLVQLGLARLAAFFGGALFALSPEFFLCPSAPITALPFLPLLLLGIERAAAAAAQRRRSGWNLIPVALAYAIYGGNPEVAMFEFLLAGGWAAWRLAAMPPAAMPRFAGKLVLGGGIGALLCAPLVVPFEEYLPLADIGLHTGVFAIVRLGQNQMPLQVLPFLYGKFGTTTPPGLEAMFGGGYVRVPGWVSLPVLALALAALWRQGGLAGLRWVLLGWVVLWEARYAGFGPALALLNAIPGVASTDATRYSGGALYFAVITLAALGLDDVQRLAAISGTRLAGVLLSLSGILAALVLPALGFIAAWYRAVPRDMGVALATEAFGAAVLLAACVLMRAGRARLLAPLLLLGPFLTLLLPQFAGMRAGETDLAPIRFLQDHLGSGRMTSLGPLDLNFGVPYGVASINFFALPSPRAFTDYIVSQLDPEADRNAYQGTEPGAQNLFLQHIPQYEALGVRYIITPSGTGGTLMPSFAPIDPGTRNFPHPLIPGGPDLVGTMWSHLPFTSVDGISVVVGTYLGRARGPVTATICAGKICDSGTADAGRAADDAMMTFSFPSPLTVPPGAALAYRFSHATGAPVAIWMVPDGFGHEVPSYAFLAAGPVHGPMLVFRDNFAAIYELPDPAPYAQIADAGCQLSIVSRQHMRSLCPGPSVLMRREMYYPGWAATVNGAPAAVSQAGLFQSVRVPAGAAEVRFSYAPPHIRAACALALAGLGFWVAFSRGSKRSLF